MRITKKQIAALDYFGLEFAKSDEPGAGWFAYDDKGGAINKYPGSSCETIDDVVRWYEAAQPSVHPTLLDWCDKCDFLAVDRETGNCGVCNPQSG
jgi:hypothetical protein